MLDILLNNEQIDLTVENYSGHRALVLAHYHPELWNWIIENMPELEDILTDESYKDLVSMNLNLGHFSENIAKIYTNMAHMMWVEGRGFKAH